MGFTGFTRCRSLSSEPGRQLHKGMDKQMFLIAGMIAGLMPITLMLLVFFLFGVHGFLVLAGQGFTNLSGLEYFSLAIAGAFSLYALWSLWLVIFNRRNTLAHPVVLFLGLLLGTILSAYLTLTEGSQPLIVRALTGAPFVLMVYLLFIAKQRGILRWQSS